MANASPRAKPTPAAEPLALFISLAAAGSGLSRRGMHALHRLRSRQLEAMKGAKGAFVKLQPNQQPPWLDMALVGRDSPLAADFHSLVTMQLITEFPERAPELQSILAARRAGLDLGKLAFDLWKLDGGEALIAAAKPHEVDAHLLALTLFAALKPLFESVSQAFVRHFPLPDGSKVCPVCGAAPWARCGEVLRCGLCEATWRGELPGPYLASEGPQARGVTRLYDSATGARLMELDESLLAAAFDPGPMIELLQLLDAPASP